MIASSVMVGPSVWGAEAGFPVVRMPEAKR